MAVPISAKNIALLVIAIALAALAWLYQSQRNSLPLAAQSTCRPLPENIVFVGRAHTIAEVERLSLAEMAEASTSVPRVPFGHQNAAWVELKASARAGDTVHEFRTPVSGGHLILRGQCVIGQLGEWVR